MKTWVGNIKDDRVARVLQQIPDACRCFDRESRNAGHDTNPPCPTVLIARGIVEDLEKYYIEGKDD
jgi:hypothetical protein